MNDVSSVKIIQPGSDLSNLPPSSAMFTRRRQKGRKETDQVFPVYIGIILEIFFDISPIAPLRDEFDVQSLVMAYFDYPSIEASNIWMFQGGP